MKRFGKPVVLLLAVLAWARPSAGAEIKMLAAAGDLPEAFSTTWAKGDLLVSEAGYLAIVGGTRRPLRTPMNYPAADAMGSLLAFVPAGRGLRNDVNIGAPVVMIGRKPEYLVYTSVTVEEARHEREPGMSPSLVATASYSGESGKRAAVRTVYTFLPDGEIGIASTITNTGAGFFKDLAYSVFFNANHSYSFSPFDRDRFPGLNFRVYPKNGFFMAWVTHARPGAAPGPQPGVLDPGQSFEVRYTLLADTDGQRLLERVYDLLGEAAVAATLEFRGFGGRTMEVVVQDVETGTVFFRTFLGNQPSLEVTLPEGQYWARANFFPAVVENLLVVREDGENSVRLEDPAKGRVRVRIRDASGAFVPGKVTFIGLDPTRSPYFEPENPLLTGRGLETVRNFRYPKEDGETLLLPAGTYLAVASRGPEYGIDQKVIEVFTDREQEVQFRVDRVLEKTGLLSLDPHLHTQFSDGTVRVPERLRSLVAEGVDLAVATDHNDIVDYAAALRELRLDPYLAVWSGEEVTPRDSYVHFNAFAMPRREDLEDGGAFPAPLATGPLAPLLAAVRRRFPRAILQLNHPRSGNLGLFNNARLDADSAALADPGFDLSFDLIEVMNGAAFFGGNEEAIKDWLHLLDRGYRFGITGSSDSHGIAGGEPGYSRTYVPWTGGPGAAPDWSALAAALKSGRAFVSNGPLVELTVNGRYIPGDTFTAKDGKVDVAMRVRAAPWVGLGELRLIVNGRRTMVLPTAGGDGTPAVLNREVSFKLDRDSYLAVEVLGWSSLFPVVQQRSRSGSYRDAALPYALTNPVFVDVDGNGRFDPPVAGSVGTRPPAGAAAAVRGR